MREQSIPEYRVTVDQLRPGVFIRLERANWFDHPFLFNSFKIKDQAQIDILRELGVGVVTCIPEKSDVLPGRAQGEGGPPKATPRPSPGPKPEVEQRTRPRSDAESEELRRLWEIKRQRAKKLAEKRKRIARTEEHYADSVRQVDLYLKGLLRGENDSVIDAFQFIRALVERFLKDRESTLHLMNVLPPTEQVYSHELNVAILALMLGKEQGLDAEEMVNLGMAALFHDIGKARVDAKVLRKKTALTKAERKLLEGHVERGREVLLKLPSFPAAAVDPITGHHEMLDGTGYPEKLSARHINLLTRILAIGNTYDNLCNHHDPAQALNPYLSLSYMFTKLKGRLDKDLLSLFIRSLGVYPPGTVVQLSNGAIGMVMSVNPENQLRPNLVIYDPEIPKKEALIIDLSEEQSLKVEKSIRLQQLPAEVAEYLNPRTKITYFVGMESGG